MCGFHAYNRNGRSGSPGRRQQLFCWQLFSISDVATSCLSGDEVEQRSTSLERSNRHSLGEDNFVDLEHNLVDLEDNIVDLEDNFVDLEDYHVDVKHVQLRHSMKIMQERHGGRGKRCFFQILQLKRFKRVKRKRAG